MFYCDRTIVGNIEAVVFDIFLCQGSDLSHHSIAGITARAFVAILDKRMYLAVDKVSIPVKASHKHGSIGGSAMKTHATRGGEIAQAIGYQVPLVKLYGTAHVRPMAIDDVGTIVDAQVGELPEVASVGSMEIFCAVGQMPLRDTFRATVEAHYNDVTLLAQLLDNAYYSSCVLSPE